MNFSKNNGDAEFLFVGNYNLKSSSWSCVEYNGGQNSLGHFFDHCMNYLCFKKLSLKKHCYPFQSSFLPPPPPTPYNVETLENVQHWAEGLSKCSWIHARPFVWRTCEKAQQVQIVPRLLSMLVSSKHVCALQMYNFISDHWRNSFRLYTPV